MFPIRHYHILSFCISRRTYNALRCDHVDHYQRCLFIYHLLIFSFLLVVRVNALFGCSLLQSTRTSRCVKADVLADLKFKLREHFHSWGESKENPQSSRSLVSSCVQLLWCPELGTDLAADSLGRVAVSLPLTWSDRRISCLFNVMRQLLIISKYTLKIRCFTNSLKACRRRKWKDDTTVV